MQVLSFPALPVRRFARGCAVDIQHGKQEFDAPVGVLNSDLRAAALAALTLPHEPCRPYAANFSWAASASRFLDTQTAIVR